VASKACNHCGTWVSHLNGYPVSTLETLEGHTDQPPTATPPGPVTPSDTSLDHAYGERYIALLEQEVDRLWAELDDTKAEFRQREDVLLGLVQDMRDTFQMEGQETYHLLPGVPVDVGAAPLPPPHALTGGRCSPATIVATPARRGYVPPPPQGAQVRPGRAARGLLWAWSWGQPVRKSLEEERFQAGFPQRAVRATA
jgi:hypothetical protein